MVYFRRIISVTAAAGGIATLTAQSVENYAEYEQLVGGVETLFKQSADEVKTYAKGAFEGAALLVQKYNEAVEKASTPAETILEKAANAFMTAGMSANDYMETVTSFSASLISSLGGDTAAAAEVADLAITDMADNANKMGTSIESIQNAYQGFAKQNYTMLDNLKLGYGGTATEMARLINESGVLGDALIDLEDTRHIGEALAEVGFAKMIEAIHVIQSEMGITGTTAAEASGTISGSISSMRAAWENLVTGMADDNADFEGLVVNFVDTVGTVAENIIPRVEQALNGAGALIERLIPVIMDKIPELVNDTLPKLLQSGVNIVQSVVDGISQNRKALVDGAMSAVNTLINGIGDMAPDIVVTGVMLTLELAAGLIKALPELIGKVPQIMDEIEQGLMDRLPELEEIGKNIVRGVWNGIKSLASWLSNKVSGFFDGIVSGVKDFLGIHSPSRVFAGIGGYMAEGLGEGWEDEYDKVKRKIESGLDFGAASISVNASGSSAKTASASVQVIQHIYSEAKTAADLMQETIYQQKRAVLLGV